MRSAGTLGAGPVAVSSWIVGVVRALGYAGVALLMALENVVPPIPSEVVMPLAGYAASQGELALGLVIAAGSAGSLAGTLPWYALARWIGKERLRAWTSRHGHWLGLDLEGLDRATRWFDRHGAAAVLLGRLVPGVRTIISVPAGFCAMPLGRFLVWSALGTIAWTAGLAVLGYVLGARYEAVGTYLGAIAWLVIGAALAIYVARVVVRVRARHRRARRA